METEKTIFTMKEASSDHIQIREASKRVGEAMFEWMDALTHSLRLWTDKGERMTSGELILARVNIGSLVESWLKLFYCVYYDDYVNSRRFNGEDNYKEPNNLSFEELKNFSREILYNSNDEWDNWISSIQHKRNAIHSFNYRDIGTADDFYDDIERFYDFICLIISRLPPIEDYIQKFIKTTEDSYEERKPVERVYCLNY